MISSRKAFFQSAQMIGIEAFMIFSEDAPSPFIFQTNL